MDDVEVMVCSRGLGGEGEGFLGHLLGEAVQRWWVWL
jgi:hypothetical protein